jgi:hypothetical protein
MLSLLTVPVLYQGPWDLEKVKSCWTGISLVGGEQEGYVIRVADAFPWDQHHLNTGKFVRKDHVQTDEHWMQQAVVPNGLKAM